MSEQANYKSWHENKLREWEALCQNCGACCGALEDPCEHLYRLENGKYVCLVYENRFGIHKTVSGQECCCVPLRSKLGQSWPGDEWCGYKKT